MWLACDVILGAVIVVKTGSLKVPHDLLSPLSVWYFSCLDWWYSTIEPTNHTHTGGSRSGDNMAARV